MPPSQWLFWVPSLAELQVDLTPYPTLQDDELHGLSREDARELAIFDGFRLTRLTADHWEIPLVVILFYCGFLFLGPRYMATRYVFLAIELLPIS